MCGILGSIPKIPARQFADALATLKDRGPDGSGTWENHEVQLGHQRLAIIDLAAGDQPMHSVCGRYHIVYNGEIYNFRELRKELSARGRDFRTRSDTEVLLVGYQEWGESVLTRLDGIFAFAIWDTQAQRLFAARDRFGVKPLFYSLHNGFTFASTLAAFHHFSEIPKRINFKALREYFAACYIPHPLSIMEAVAVLPPAHCCLYDRRKKSFEARRYWDISPAAHTAIEDDTELLAGADHVIRESVRRQMVSDVPLGAFLSGGVDSSLIVAYMSDVRSDPVKTFSVKFMDGGDRFDETHIARQVAERFGTEHHVIEAEEISGKDMLNVVSSLDQPLADPAYLPTQLMAYYCRRYVKVALAGDGGDELFGGYERYLKDERFYHRSGVTVLRHLRKLVELGLLPASFFSVCLDGREKLIWKNMQFSGYPATKKSLDHLFRPEWFPRLSAADTRRAWLQNLERWSDTIDSDALMRADLWTYLSDNCLVKTDRAGMLRSLEVRVPLLGNPVVDFILPYHAAVKLRHGLKWVLKRLAERHLPRDVWARPKHGFSIPLASYFRGPWKKESQALIDDVQAIAPFLDGDYCRRLWSSALTTGKRCRDVWMIVVLLQWLTTYRLSD